MGVQAMSDAPTVELIENAFYWIKPSYGKDADRWTVAKWEVGFFWGLSGSEVTPKVISGPIPNPLGNAEAGDSTGRDPVERTEPTEST